MKQSAFPEYFEGLAPLNMKPDPDRNFSILKKTISVHKMKRNLELVPCHTCGHGKFFYGGYLVLDEFGFLYLIGPDCGRKHFSGQRFQDEEDRFDREEAERRAHEYFLQHLDAISGIVAYADRLTARVEEAHRIHKRLHINKPSLVDLRTALSKRDGVLEVTGVEKRLRQNGDLDEETIFIPVARIVGKAAVDKRFRMLEHVAVISKVLEPFGSTIDSAFDHINLANSDNGIPELHADFLEAVRRLGTLRVELQQFAQFFSEQNFGQITRWAEHPKNHIALEVRCEGTERALTHKGARRRNFVDVGKLLQPLPDNPPVL